jgi:hypothetical protein
VNEGTSSINYKTGGIKRNWFFPFILSSVLGVGNTALCLSPHLKVLFLTQRAVFGILLSGVDVSMLRISRVRLKGLVRSSEKVSSILYV